MFDHLQQTRVRAKEILPEVRATLDKVFLILAIADLSHPLDQQSVAIILDERVPVRAPNYFDHIPTGTAEDCFQLLNNLAVAAHGTVEPLQVAINDEDQIV